MCSQDFGVAPGLILYSWQLHELHDGGWIAAMVFAISGGLRLARFNATMDDPNKPAFAANYFTGVPAPAGAITVLLPIYLAFLGLPSPPAVLTALYTLLIAFLILVVQSSDVLQYVWGKLLGRHPIAPRLSPSKTVEGFAGGVISATFLGVALWWITPFSPWQAAIMALVINLMGFCGGLVMSAIKRDRGVKAYGTLVSGHAGVLDRIDSLCFAAPVFFHITRFFFSTI